MLKSLINLIFPEEKICFMCDEYDQTVKDYICPKCKSKLQFIDENRCKICGRQLEKIGTCRSCLGTPHYFTRVVPVLVYNKSIKQHIYDFKYNNKSYKYKLFAEFMIKSILQNDLEYTDLIVPVPLHKHRLNSRGFNQSYLLGKYISTKLNIPIDNKNLIRIGYTKEQNKLKRLERTRNISKVFSIIDSGVFKNKRILLIDDIYTTGSTVDACSKLLLENEAREVFVSTIAAGKL